MFFSKLFLIPYYRFRNAVMGIPKIETTARLLAQTASKHAFRVYRSTAFKNGVSFDTLETVEQDRIFNELVVTNLVLEILMMETFAKFANGNDKEWARKTANEIPRQFLASLHDLSIGDEYVEIWRKLITLRQDEYEQTRLEHRDHFSELGEGNPWIQVVAFSCLFHIRRGKGVSNDPLLSILIEQAIGITNVTRRTIQPIAFAGH